MLYSKEKISLKCPQECWREVTWYLTDSVGQIAIVSSGGGLIPDSISSMPEDELVSINSYFASLPIIADEVFFSENYLRKLNLKENLQFKDSNLKTMKTIVSRGLFSFDKFRLMNYDDFEYFLEAKPNIPVTIHDIDKEIRQVIEKTIIKKNFKIDDLFFVNEIA